MSTIAAPRILLAVHHEQLPGFFESGQLERLAGLGELVHWPEPIDWAYAPGLAETEVILTGWQTARLTPAVLDQAPALRAVVHCAGSVRFLIDPVAYRRGIAVSSQAVTNAAPVAQHATATILLALRDAFWLREEYRRSRGRFDRDAAIAGIGIAGRTVGIVGASTIGRLVVAELRRSPVRIRLYDPTLTDDDPVLDGVHRDRDLNELCAVSDVVSLHAPLLPTTRGLVDAAALAALPTGATLVNTARGGIVDEAALIAELSRRRIRAVLDVTTEEPPAPDSPLWELPNAFLTPHLAGAGSGELRLLGRRAVDEVERWVRGEPLQGLVTGEDHERRA